MTAAPSIQRARALAAADALPPTFPIATFVAANPLRGVEHLSFEHAAAHAAATSGAESFLSEAEYRRLHAEGRIGEHDLRRALLRRWPGPDAPRRIEDPDVELALVSLLTAPVEQAPGQVVHTRAAAHDERLAERVDAMVARWCAAYLDRGQADWVLPGREQGLYRAWHRLAPHDPGLRRLVGRSGRRAAGELPEDPASALSLLVERLRIDDASTTEYFRASLRRLPGWGAAIARGDDPDDLVGLLALRLALEHLALGELPDAAPWTAPTLPDTLAPSLQRRAIWQEALELAYRDRLLGTLTGPAAAAGPVEVSAPASQVVMCIDVRSEGMRRHLEQVGPHATLGFAGFFGLPVRVADLDHEPVASCPVIVEPRATVHEVPEVGPRQVHARHDRHEAEEAAWDARHDAKSAPAAPFAFAEAAGWVLGPLAALRTFSPRSGAALARRAQRGLVPDLPTRMDVGPDADVAAGPEAADGSDGYDGFSPQEQVRVAHGALTTMGLTSGFAPLVVFCGHRSATTNNPFAAALDCGACAGKAGGPNARALTELLNRRAVRAGLVDAGIVIPDTTWFVAAEHETTTDTVHLLDRHRVPASHLARLDALEADLAEAGRRLAAERAASLPVTGGAPASGDDVLRRSADWAEPLPEWGLVRNAAVVVGPRSLSAGRDLERRVFLHSYDAEADVDGAALGAILTGPLVVGHWISSQYYFSTVDPVRHGAGTKPLHNVVGGIGVHEGPGGDLRVGLPLESVQFGGERVHEPLRLLAVVHAPVERLDGLIARNAAVAQLLDNGWIRLVVGGPDGWQERLRGGRWEPCDPPAATPTDDADVEVGRDDHRHDGGVAAGSMSAPVSAGIAATGRLTDGP